MGLHNLARHHAHACGAQSYPQKEQRYNGVLGSIVLICMHACYLYYLLWVKEIKLRNYRVFQHYVIIARVVKVSMKLSIPPKTRSLTWNQLLHY